MGKPYADSAYVSQERASYWAPLVHRLAKSIYRRLATQEELDDLVQAGMVALVETLRRYPDLSEDETGRTLNRRIRGAIMDHLRRRDPLSRADRDRVRALGEATKMLQDRGLSAHPAEVGRHLGWSADETADVISLASTNNPVLNCDVARIEDIARDTPEAHVMRRDLARRLEQAIARLPPRWQTILSLHYQQELTYRQIAQVVQLSPARISQIMGQACARLQAAMEQ